MVTRRSCDFFDWIEVGGSPTGPVFWFRKAKCPYKKREDRQSYDTKVSVSKFKFSNFLVSYALPEFLSWSVVKCFHMRRFLSYNRTLICIFQHWTDLENAFFVIRPAADDVWHGKLCCKVVQIFYDLISFREKKHPEKNGIPWSMSDSKSDLQPIKNKVFRFIFGKWNRLIWLYNTWQYTSDFLHETS